MIGTDHQPSPDLRAEVAALVTAGAMLALPAREPDPVHAVIAAHCAALAAFSAECEKAPDTCDEEHTKRLGLAEARERRTLLPFVPATLAGLEVKLAYCAAFCLPAWREFGAGDEAAVLLKATAEALARLVG